MTAPADSSVLTKVLTIYLFFPFIIDNCNYGSLFRKGKKMNILFTFCNSLSKN